MLPYLQPAPTPPPQTPWEHPLSSAEIRIVEELYAVGEGAPAIRQQVLSIRLGLDVAEQLEEMGIYDAGTMTPADRRQLIELVLEQLAKDEAEAAAAEIGVEQDDPEVRAKEKWFCRCFYIPLLATCRAKLSRFVLLDRLKKKNALFRLLLYDANVS